MMRRFGTCLAVATLGFLGFGAAPAVHAQAAFPTKAPQVKFWLARAMDPCTPSGMTVIGAGLPTSGCLQANSVTDGTSTMKYGRIRVTKNGRIALSGNGFTFGDVFRVRLQLRVTKKGLTTKNPVGTNQTVTFVDQTVDCPPAPSAFTVRPNGTIASSTELASCLSPNTGLAGGTTPTQPNNIEIVDASLVSVLTGKIVARPGIVR